MLWSKVVTCGLIYLHVYAISLHWLSLSSVSRSRMLLSCRSPEADFSLLWQPVYVEDVTDAMAMCALSDVGHGLTLELGGKPRRRVQG